MALNQCARYAPPDAVIMLKLRCHNVVLWLARVSGISRPSSSLHINQETWLWSPIWPRHLSRLNNMIYSKYCQSDWWNALVFRAKFIPKNVCPTNTLSVLFTYTWCTIALSNSYYVTILAQTNEIGVLIVLNLWKSILFIWLWTQAVLKEWSTSCVQCLDVLTLMCLISVEIFWLLRKKQLGQKYIL